MPTPRTVVIAILFFLVSLSAVAQITNTPAVLKAKDQSETAIAINPANSLKIMAAWNDLRVEGIDGNSKPGFAFSTNGGSNWSDSIILNGSTPIDASDPSVAFGHGDTAYYCYLSPIPGGHNSTIYIARTTTLGPPWPLQTALITNSAVDKPYMAIDNTGGGRDGYIYACWINTFATVQFAVSTDRGVTYSTQTLESNSDGHHSPIPVVGANGDVYVFWTDLTHGKHKMEHSTNGGVSFASVVEVDTLFKYIKSSNGHYLTSSWQSVATDPTTANNLYIVYMDQASSADTSRRVWFKRSKNNGTTWIDKKIIADFGGAGWQFQPSVTASGNGRVSVSLYHTLVTDSIVNVYMTVSTDSGASFPMVPRRITTVGSNAWYLGNPQGGGNDYMGVTSYQTHAYPVWTDSRNGTLAAPNADVYFASVEEAPANQTSDISGATAYGGTPKTLFSSRSNRWNLIYQSGGDLYHTYSIDSGSTWSLAEIISGYQGNGSGGITNTSNPTIQEDTSGALHVIYTTGGGFYYSYKPLGGSWRASPILLTADIGLSYPSFAVNPNGTGHLVYVRYVEIGDNLAGTSYVYYGNFTLSTSSPNFTEVKQLYNAGHTVVSMTGLTELSSGQLHALWANTGEIYYRYGSGTSWSTTTNISNTSGLSNFPSIMSYSRNGYEIYVVWQENVSSGNDEIYYRLNTNGTWGSNQNLSNTSGLSQSPCIAGFKPTSTTDTALVMWAEKPAGSGTNYDIYYKLLSRGVKHLTSTSPTSAYPAFACKNSTNRLLAVWTEGDAASYAVADTTLSSSTLLSATRMGANLEEERQTPYQYALEQNYPNPFNPTTEFRFSVADAGFVSLKIYDVLGQELETLVDEVKEPGEYTLTWDGSRASSGVYYYRLKSGNFSDTKKMLLIH